MSSVWVVFEMSDGIISLRMSIVTNLKEKQSEEFFASLPFMKSVRIQNYSGPYFPAFGLNT